MINHFVTLPYHISSIFFFFLSNAIVIYVHHLIWMQNMRHETRIILMLCIQCFEWIEEFARFGRIRSGFVCVCVLHEVCKEKDAFFFLHTIETECLEADFTTAQTPNDRVYKSKILCSNGMRYGAGVRRKKKRYIQRKGSKFKWTWSTQNENDRQRRWEWTREKHDAACVILSHLKRKKLKTVPVHCTLYMELFTYFFILSFSLSSCLLSKFHHCSVVLCVHYLYFALQWFPFYLIFVEGAVKMWKKKKHQ